jgi:hypothetical protein
VCDFLDLVLCLSEGRADEPLCAAHLQICTVVANMMQGQERTTCTRAGIPLPSPNCRHAPQQCLHSCCSGGSLSTSCPPDCVPWIPCCNSGSGLGSGSGSGNTGSSSHPPACGGCTYVTCTNMCGAMPCQFCDGHGHCDSQPQPCA